MVKKILVLSRRKFSYFPRFVEEGKRVHAEVTCSLFSDVSVSFSGKYPEIFVGNVPLKHYPLVYIRTAGKYGELQGSIAEYCGKHHIPLYDQARRLVEPWVDSKSFEYIRLMEFKLPVIPSVFLHATHIVQNIRDISFPCVAKQTCKDCGLGVVLCTNRGELKDLLCKHGHLLVQPFLPNNGDIRIIILGEKVLGAIKRKSEKPGEFRNNISLGDIATPYTVSLEQKKIAIQAAKALGYSFAGVDLIYNRKAKRWEIMEVNISPQFTAFEKVTHIDVVRELIAFLASKIK